MHAISSLTSLVMTLRVFLLFGRILKIDILPKKGTLPILGCLELRGVHGYHRLINAPKTAKFCMSINIIFSQGRVHGQPSMLRGVMTQDWMPRGFPVPLFKTRVSQPEHY